MILDVATGLPATGYKLFYNPTRPYALAFSPDGMQLAVVSRRGDTVIWDMKKRERLWLLTSSDLSTRTSTEVNAGVEGLNTVAYSPDGRHLLTGGLDMALRVWETQAWSLEQTLRGHANAVTVAAFSPDGTSIASGDVEGVLKLWQLGSRAERPAFGTALTSKGMYSLAQRPDAQQVLVVGDVGVQLWDTQTGTRVDAFPGTYTVGALSPDGALVAVVAQAGPNRRTAPITVWNIATREQVARRELELGESVWGLQFSPDGTRLAAVGWSGTAWVLATSDLATLTEIKGTSPTTWSLAFSHDGQRLLLAAGDGTARVYDAEEGRLLQTFRSSIDLRDAVYSPDEHLVALAARDGSIVIYEAKTGLLLREINAHSTQVSSVTFSPDGKLLVSTSFDGTARLWDANTGEPRTTLWTHSQPLVDAAFSPDGSSVAVLSLDGRVRQYLVRVDDLRALAEQLVSRELTSEELGRYLGEAPTTPTASP